MPNANNLARWASGRHVGPAKPVMVVHIQRGLMDRTYQPLVMLDGSQPDFGSISGSTHNDRPWQAFWRATGVWTVVPNVSQADIEQGFDANGVATATITIQNVLMQRAMGAVGAYTLMRRGYLSPWLGFVAIGRPFTGQALNEWFDLLNGGYRIKIWQGYGGDAIEPEFTGLCDDTDIRVSPDVITITARDFGQLLTDQRVFGSVKAKELRSPITFADSKDMDDTEKISAGAAASTSDPGYPASNVTKMDDTYWRSHPHTGDATEWVELHLPKGRYEDFYLDPQYAGMECWISVYMRNTGLGGKKATVNGGDVDNGWVAFGGGIVPGDNGGHPSVRHIPSLGSQPLKREIGFSMNCGDNTVLRLSFRNLPPGGDGRHRAGVRRFVAYRRKRKKELKGKKWVMVNDAADIVRWVFMWAGFKEWEVEDFGVNIKDPMTFHQSDYLIDIVKHMMEQGGYVYYMKKPTTADGSLGVPVFRRTRATASGPVVLDIRDTNVLTGLETRFSKESLAYIIRFRGAASNKGKSLGEDTSKRVMATYFPPWSGAHHDVITGAYAPTGLAGRLAGVIKHVVHTDQNLETADECMMACILTAIQEALAAYTGNIQVPGIPGLSLDDQVSVIDNASGTNQRMWLAQKNSSFTVGEDGTWTTTLGGSMLDTPDLQVIANDYLRLLAKVVRQ